MELFEFLTGTTSGKCLFTMLVSMIPVIELRGGLPFGVALGLPYYLLDNGNVRFDGGISCGGGGQSDPRPLHHRLHPPDF